MKKIILLLFISFAMIRCGDVIEHDLTNTLVTVITPVDNYVSSSAALQIKWEAVPGASAYQLQVVKPSFSVIKSFVIDSNITSTSFTYTFKPGNYQLRIRAKNSSSTGYYKTVSFSVDSTLLLTNQIVVIRKPDTLSNMTRQLFLWDPVPNATDYRLEISGPISFINASIKTDTISYLLTDGVYNCRIRAQNDQSVSAYTSFHLTIDSKAPDKPLLLTPTHKATLTKYPISFTWDNGTTGGSKVRDSLFIYSDSLLTTLKTPAITTNTAGYTFTDSVALPRGGTYYWRVRTYDAAGNKSNYSDKFRFTLN